MPENNQFPYLTPFLPYVKQELEKREANDGNFIRQKRTPWVRVVSNAVSDISDLTGAAKGTLTQGLILSPNRLTFADAYGYGKDGTVVGLEATKGFTEVRSTDKDRHRPPPIVDSIDIDYAGSYGALTKASITFRVFSIDQFEIVERFFLMPYVTILVEWGWNDYGQTPVPITNTEDMLKIYNRSDDYVEDLRAKSFGKHDAMVGVVTNFQYSINNEGAFECNIEVSSRGEMYLMMKNSSIQPKKVKDIPDKSEVEEDPLKEAVNKLRREIPTLGIRNTNDEPSEYIFIPKLKSSAEDGGTENEVNVTQEAAAGNYSSPISPEIGNVFYIKWGWIEDNILSNLKLSNVLVYKGFKTDTGKKADMFTINSTNSTISNHPNLISCNSSILLIPNKSAPSFDTLGKPFSQSENAINQALADKPRYRSDLSINNENFSKKIGDTTSKWDGDIRNLYIHSEFLISLLKKHEDSVYNFLTEIIKKMNEASCNLWDLDISDKFKIDGKRVISIIDKNYAAENNTVADLLLNKEKKVHHFQVLKANSIINSMNFTSQLPKEMGAVVMLSRDETQSKDMTIGGYLKDSSTAPWKTTDKILNAFDIEKKETNTTSDEKNISDKEASAYAREKLYKLVPQIETDKLTVTFACNDKQTVSALLFEGGTEKRNNYNNNILIPIEITLTIDGLSGLHIGNIFTVDGISRRYQEYGLWQVVGLKHSISDANWQTEIRGMMRVKSRDVE